MKHNDATRKITMILASAGIYLLFDMPARLTGFMGLESFAGPKNFLPLLLGLLLGKWSVPGMWLGVLLSASLCGSSIVEVLAELMSIPILALGGQFLWYAKNVQTPRLKHGKDYIRFLLSVAVLAPLSALPALALLGVPAGVEQAAFCGAFTILVGIPVLILITSILCILPMCPSGKPVIPDVDCRISSDSGGLIEANEQIETFCETHGIPMKKVLAVENIVEELVLRIQNANAGASIHVNLYISDNASLFLSFPGEHYNPLRKSPDEKWEDLWSLTLIRERALRASYRYVGRVNRLHIVI